MEDLDTRRPGLGSGAGATRCECWALATNMVHLTPSQTYQERTPFTPGAHAEAYLALEGHQEDR